MQIVKRNGNIEELNIEKIKSAIGKAFNSLKQEISIEELESLVNELNLYNNITVEEIQDQIEEMLNIFGHTDVSKAFIVYRKEHERIRNFVKQKQEFIQNYKVASNAANATIDDNSNVANKNIGTLNSEIHKPENIQISRVMIVNKLKELFPEFDSKQYIKDLESHIIYKHDESSFAGPIAPYCCSISLYPFLTDGLKHIGGLSASPQNIDSFCGMYINLIFAVSAQFAGAVATSEFLLYFTYFAKKEWGDDFWQYPDKVINCGCRREKTIRKQIHQYWQQVIYSINQPAAARGLQSAFINFSYFDKAFFNGMFENFYFPDGTKPDWESLEWVQQEFMQWFNNERLRTILTFPVESFALVYKDGKFVDEKSAKFVAEEYARGHSFFTYISDTVDSLSSCCRLKNKVQTKEFNFTNGNMGIMTGSKSVITLNLNRIIQDWCKENEGIPIVGNHFDSLKLYLDSILGRVYKYHIAYNELLWDMYDASLLPVYKSGFIDLNKQYLTIGINGLNQAAEFLGITCSDNNEYRDFCQAVFSIIKNFNESHKGKFNGHQITLNTECVPKSSGDVKLLLIDSKLLIGQRGASRNYFRAA